MKGKIRNPIKDPSLIASVSLSPPSRLPLNPFIFSHAMPILFLSQTQIKYTADLWLAELISSKQTISASEMANCGNVIG